MKASSWGVVLCGALLSGMGCDDTPTVPESLVEEPAPAPSIADAPPVPTTQELVSGPYATLDLPTMPLNIHVPQSWKIMDLDHGAVILLTGHAPGGEVQINLTHRPPTTKEKIDVVLEGARQEMADDPKHILKMDFYERGPMKVLERQVAWTASRPNPTALPGEEMSPLVRWTITTYVPAGEGFNSYELSFLSLTERQFNTDEAFLKKIIDSLAFDPTREISPVTSAPPPAQP